MENSAEVILNMRENLSGLASNLKTLMDLAKKHIPDDYEQQLKDANINTDDVFKEIDKANKELDKFKNFL